LKPLNAPARNEQLASARAASNEPDSLNGNFQFFRQVAFNSRRNLIMKRIVFFSIFITLLCAVSFLSASSAQQQRQTSPPTQAGQPQVRPTPPTGDTIVTRINEVRLPVSVVNRRGEPVTGLTQADFQILEDRQPQQILGFLTETSSPPIYVGVLMDTSASTAGKLRFEQEAAMNFIHTVIRLRRDQAAFVTFNDEVTLRQDFTDRLDLLERAVNNVGRPNGNTALYNAVWRMCNEKMRNVPGRRVLVIITDGEDTMGQTTLREAIDIAQRTETTIFAISTREGLSATVTGVEMGTVNDRGDNNLERLCEETGGRAFFIGDQLALERSFSRVARELRGQYILTYRPANDNYDGRFRQVQVRLTGGNRDGIRVRTRRGYMAISDSVTGTR
jgi:Ca-activated chloride channel homolog